MDQLIDSGIIPDPEHLIGYLREMCLGHLKALPVVLQKIPDGLDLRQLEKGIQLSADVKEDIQGMYLFLAFWREIGGVAFKYVWQVGAEPVDLVGPEGMHIIFRYQGALSLADPG